MSRHFLPTSVLIALIACAATAHAQPKKKPAETAAVPEFDRAAAVTAITGADLTKCRATNAARGEGHVFITFATSGESTDVKIDKGPWVGTPVAKCMVKEFKKAKVPAFKGEAVTVGKTFTFGQ